MGIPLNALPDDALSITYAYDVAVAIVNRQLQGVPGPIYMLAVYNLAGDNLLHWAPDVPGVPYPSENPDKLGYFAFLRKKWDLNGFTPGLIQSSADETTSQSMVVPEQFKELTIANLQNIKTPYGRQYLAFAQSVGTMWGLS